MALTNIFEQLPDASTAEVFEQIIEEGNFRIERITSKGQSSPDSVWQDQPQHEWVLLLEGEAIVSFAEGHDHQLSKGGFINIPAGTKHRVKWTHPELDTVWLAVHYSH